MSRKNRSPGSIILSVHDVVRGFVITPDETTGSSICSHPSSYRALPTIPASSNSFMPGLASSTTLEKALETLSQAIFKRISSSFVLHTLASSITCLALTHLIPLFANASINNPCSVDPSIPRVISLPCSPYSSSLSHTALT